MESLYEGIQSSKLEQWEFQASIHGIDVTGNTSTNSTPTQTQSEPGMPLFGDPESYQSLSNEEREVATQKMLFKHRVWAGESFKKG